MRAKQRTFAAVLLVLSMLSSAGCAVAHRYPAYQGRVLELGTDKAIEGAGVLAVYRMNTYTMPESNTRYVGYQAVLTDNTGQFEVPSKTFFSFYPMAMFDSDARITIYKRGYGNFPASFPFFGSSPGVSRGTPAKEGKTDPVLNKDQLSPGREVTFWLPKLETEEEIREHDRIFSPLTTDVLDEKDFPPPGTKKGQFLPPKYTGEGS